MASCATRCIQGHLVLARSPFSRVSWPYLAELSLVKIYMLEGSSSARFGIDWTRLGPVFFCPIIPLIMRKTANNQIA
ncbi:hypothetical protein RRG08_029588 [Elysia crispata]|uniref:Uncharacterized protein n=1 Tax=Elysia crispata TaxID=231223 RepID=A0AAE0XPA2_9GAST|nr:hypothetical protein RRG08_029588 [Elysia crispata]